MSKVGSRITVVIAIILFAIISYNFGGIPFETTTFNRLDYCKSCIIQYTRLHNKMPISLQEVSKIEHCQNILKDGRGNNFIYVVLPNNIITLRSHRGGANSDNKGDIIGRFIIKNSDGSWANEDTKWLEDPQADWSAKHAKR